MVINPQQLQDRLEQQTGVALAALLAPIDPQQPCGQSMREQPVYQQIKQARQGDDPSLPRGHWEHELKRPNWQQVSQLSLEALQHSSKDLQLAIWLLEAQVHCHGFAGIAPMLYLIEQLCQQYWPSVHPQMIDGDIEYRTNVLRWLNDRLLPCIRMLPLNQDQTAPLTWSAIEQAHRNEQLKHSLADHELEGLQWDDCIERLTLTDTAWLGQLQHDMACALYSIDHLVQTLDHCCGDETPSLGHLQALLQDIEQLLLGEWHRRGELGPGDINAQGEHASIPSDPVAPSELLHSRMQAYAQIEQIAQFLQYIEPHSPVPFLLQRCVQWGNMNTCELYQTLFVQGQGKLNIFEVLGLSEAH